MFTDRLLESPDPLVSPPIGRPTVVVHVLARKLAGAVRAIWLRGQLHQHKLTDWNVREDPHRSLPVIDELKRHAAAITWVYEVG